MQNNRLQIINTEGFAKCQSVFGSYYSVLDNYSWQFNSGITVISGDIDSGGWTLCYLLSMCGREKNIIIDPASKLVYNNVEYSFVQFAKKVGYIDKRLGLSYFENYCTVEKLLRKKLMSSKSSLLYENVISLFQLDKQRLHRPLIQCGNEYIRARAAIEFASGKDVFCFPWLSDKQFNYYKEHICFVCSVLSENSKIVIIPTANQFLGENWSWIDMRC